MISFQPIKGVRGILCVILAVCFLTVPAAGRTAAAENAAEEETVERHWYTFSLLPWGLSSSTNEKYLALYGPYNISDQDAWAIGRVKGMSTEVKVYTNDPEERLIWSFSPNGFTGVFLRSGFTLPDPDTEPEAGSLALVAGDQVFPLSDASLSELTALRETIETVGTSPEESGMKFDPDSANYADIAFAYRELPGLQRLLLLTAVRDGDRLILLSWKENDSGYEADRFVEIAPESELYREISEAIEAAG